MATAALAVALKAPDPRERELAYLCLLMGLLRAARTVPRESLVHLLDALTEGEDGR